MFHSWICFRWFISLLSCRSQRCILKSANRAKRSEPCLALPLPQGTSAAIGPWLEVTAVSVTGVSAWWSNPKRGPHRRAKAQEHHLAVWRSTATMPSALRKQTWLTRPWRVGEAGGVTGLHPMPVLPYGPSGSGPSNPCNNHRHPLHPPSRPPNYSISQPKQCWFPGRACMRASLI